MEIVVRPTHQWVGIWIALFANASNSKVDVFLKIFIDILEINELKPRHLLQSLGNMVNLLFRLEL